MAFYVDFMQPASGDSPISVPAATFRMLAASLAGLPNDGVIGPVSAVVTHRAAGANFSVDIQTFQAVVAGNDVTDQGSYLITNSSVANWPTPTAPGSGTRTHRLVGQVRDKRAAGTWSTYDWTPVLLADSGSGLPALPPSAIDLASISISAGQANVQDSNITLRYPVLRSLVISGPWESFQTGVGAWNSTNTWVGYGPSNWPTVPFTVPPSGQVYVTIFAGVIGSAGNTAAVGFGISGTDSVNPTFGRCVSAGSGASAAVTIRASNRSLVTGLTPGASDVASAFWNMNGSGCSDTNDGHLIVEAVQ
jgi:hypothetical protein